MCYSMQQRGVIYVSEECPALKILEVCDNECDDHTKIILSLIVKLKNLEVLTIGYSSCILKILKLIHSHLPKFIGLCIKDGEAIDNIIVLAIVSLFPKIKYLILNNCNLQKEYLLLLLQGCKELVCLTSETALDL